MKNHARFIIALILGTSVSGCAMPAAQRPYLSDQPLQRNPLEAERLTLRAAKCLDSDPARAETLLRAALTADLHHGPAHNNLGVLFLNQNRLYDAANEFEWARKLMPGHPDPRLNLAMTLERAGRIDEALDSYASALAVYPGHLPSLQGLARCQIRHGRLDNHTPGYLASIALAGESPAWRDWAQSQQLAIDERALE